MHGVALRTAECISSHYIGHEPANCEVLTSVQVESSVVGPGCEESSGCGARDVL